MKCESCGDFRSLDDAILMPSYGVCKKSGRAVFKNSETCGIEKWHRRYISRLMGVAGLTLFQAEDCLSAGLGEYDYDDEPEDSADDEMSYWTADEGETNY